MHLALCKGSSVYDKAKPVVPAVSDRSIQPNNIAYINSFIYLIFCKTKTNKQKPLREICWLSDIFRVNNSAPKPPVAGVSGNAA